MTKDIKLKDPAFFMVVKEAADDYISDNDFTEAYNLGAGLDGEIEKKEFRMEVPELYKKYKEMVIKLLWVGLPVMTQGEIKRMFREHFVKSCALIPDYEYWYKLKPALLSIKILDNRDVFKRQLMQALAENQEKITYKRLTVNGVEKEPTVANWILDYNRVLGASATNGIARTQYLVNSVNVKSLSKEEKGKIQKLFELYERLKLSSQTLEGYEFDIPVNELGVNGTIRQGVFEPTPPETKRDIIVKGIIDEMMGRTKTTAGKGKEDQIAALINLSGQYPAGSLERRAIEEEIRKLENKKPV